jgi:Tfp pilus assembly protein PilV
MLCVLAILAMAAVAIVGYSRSGAAACSYVLSLQKLASRCPSIRGDRARLDERLGTGSRLSCRGAAQPLVANVEVDGAAQQVAESASARTAAAAAVASRSVSGAYAIDIEAGWTRHHRRCADRFAMRCENRRTAGFSLVEVVVAVVICALAIVGLFQAGSTGLFAADTAGKVQKAIQRAQSRLASVGRESAIAEGESEGDDSGGFRWHLRIHPSAAQTFPAPPVLMTLYDVEVTVSWPTGRRDRSVVLRTRRLAAASLQ